MLEKDVDFEHRIIDLSNKPDDFLAKYATVSSERAKVPLLEHGDDVIVIESDVVTRYVANQVEGRSKTHDLGTQEKTSLADAWGQVQLAVINILKANSEEEVNRGMLEWHEAMQKLDQGVANFEAEGLSPLTSFGVTECIVAPWVWRMFVSLRVFRNIDVETDELPKYPHASRWLRAVRDRPSVEATCVSEAQLISSYRKFFVKYISPGASAAETE